MSFQIILDIFIIILLVPTIYYAVNLNKRLDILRKSKNELMELMKDFDASMQKAETGIPQLKEVADVAADKLQGEVAKAQVLRDDMEFINSSANGLATRLESLVSQGRVKIKSEELNMEEVAVGEIKGNDIEEDLAQEEIDGKSSKTLLGALAMDDGEDFNVSDRSAAEKELLEALKSVK